MGGGGVREDILAARAQWHKYMEEAPGYPEGMFAGKGIVILGGGLTYMVPAWVNVHMLRRTGSNPPPSICPHTCSLCTFLFPPLLLFLVDSITSLCACNHVLVHACMRACVSIFPLCTCVHTFLRCCETGVCTCAGRALCCERRGKSFSFAAPFIVRTWLNPPLLFRVEEMVVTGVVTLAWLSPAYVGWLPSHMRSCMRANGLTVISSARWWCTKRQRLWMAAWRC